MNFKIFYLGIICFLIEDSYSLNKNSLDVRERQAQAPQPFNEFNLTAILDDLPPEMGDMSLLQLMINFEGKRKGGVIANQSLGCKLGIFPATQCLTRCDFENVPGTNCGTADPAICPSYCFNCPVACVVQQQGTGCTISSQCPSPCC